MPLLTIFQLYRGGHVLLVEETGVLGENHDLSQVTDKLYHIMLYRVHLVWAGFKLTTLVVIGTDCIGSMKIGNIMKTSFKLYHWYDKTYTLKGKNTHFGQGSFKSVHNFYKVSMIFYFISYPCCIKSNWIETKCHFNNLL